MQQQQRSRATGRALLGAVTAAFVSLLLSPASALPLAARGGAPQLQAASACKGLFGVEASRARNARARASHLDWIEEDEAGVTVAHTHPRWVEPTLLSVRGIHLTGVQRGVAIFELDAGQAAARGCRPGRFRLRADDSIGGRSRILAVLTQGVLVEWAGALRFIPAPGQRRPRFVMGWRLPGEVQAVASSPSPRRYSPISRYPGTISLLRGRAPR